MNIGWMYDDVVAKSCTAMLLLNRIIIVLLLALLHPFRNGPPRKHKAFSLYLTNCISAKISRTSVKSGVLLEFTGHVGKPRFCVM